MIHHEVTEEEIRDFQEQWKIPILKICNNTGRKLADGSLDGRAGIMVRWLSAKAPFRVYQITFNSGLIFTPMRKVALFTYAVTLNVAPPFFCTGILTLLINLNFRTKSNDMLHQSVPDLLFTLPVTPYTGLLFSPPTQQKDLCSVARTGLQ